MPRTKVTVRDVYKFEELSDNAKEKAREWWRHGCHEDWEPSFEDFDICAKALGVTLDRRTLRNRLGPSDEPLIHYSVGDRGEFCTFSGAWGHNPDALTALREHCNDPKLECIASELDRAFAGARLAGATTVQAECICRGCDDRIMDIIVSTDLLDGVGDGAIPTPVADTVGECMSDFAHWMLKQMRDDYEYQLSDECVDESITANEYEFDEDGAHA